MEYSLISWSYITKSFVEIILILFLTMIIMLVPHFELRFYSAALWWLVMPELILYFALIDNSGGVIYSLLKKRWMIALGEVCFSMYMIHYLGISVLHAIFGKLKLDMIWQVEFTITFLLILSASYLVFHFYETPVSSHLKKKLI